MILRCEKSAGFKDLLKQLC